MFITFLRGNVKLYSEIFCYFHGLLVGWGAQKLRVHLISSQLGAVCLLLLQVVGGRCMGGWVLGKIESNAYLIQIWAAIETRAISNTMYQTPYIQHNPSINT